MQFKLSQLFSGTLLFGVVLAVLVRIGLSEFWSGVAYGFWPLHRLFVGRPEPDLPLDRSVGFEFGCAVAVVLQIFSFLVVGVCFLMVGYHALNGHWPGCGDTEDDDETNDDSPNLLELLIEARDSLCVVDTEYVKDLIDRIDDAIVVARQDCEL